MNRIILFLLASVITSATFANDIVMSTSETTEKFFPELMQVVVEAYENAGHTVVKKSIPGERAIAMFKAGEIDADVMRLANFKDTVPDAVPVPVVLANLDMVAIVKSDSPFQSVADLKGKSMSSTKGTKVHTLIGKKMSAAVKEQSSFEASAKMVAAGRADFMAVTKPIAKQFIDAGMDVRVIEEPLLQIPFYTWVTAANAGLVPGVEAELKKLKEAGRF